MSQHEIVPGIPSRGRHLPEVGLAVRKAVPETKFAEQPKILHKRAVNNLESRQQRIGKLKSLRSLR